MKRLIFSLVVVTAIAISAVVVTSCGSAQAQGGGGAKVERWEYKVMYDDSMPSMRRIEGELNRLGSEGWEVISAGSGNATADSFIILKRKRQ